jgi:hypothetical protein
MPTLWGYDAVIAVTDQALTRGFHRLFGGAAAGTVSFDIDADHGKRLEATLEAPVVTFLSPTAAQVTFAISSGTYFGGEIVNVKTNPHTIETVTEKLDGSSLSFTVDVATMGHAGGTIHEADFSREQLYLDLTQVKAIDTTQFSLTIGEHGDVAAIVNGLVEHLKATAGAADDPDLAGRLVASSIRVPTVRDPSTPFVPSSASFSITMAPAAPTAPQAPQGGDLNFLLCMAGHPLPTDPKAGLFDSPWTSRPGGKPAHDGALVISDHVILDTIARPMILKAYAGASLTLDVGDATNPSRLHLTAPLATGDDVSLTACEATVHDGIIDLLLHVEKSERLQIGSVDFSFVTVIIPHERRIGLKVVTDATGDLGLSVASDVSTNLDVRVESNFHVGSIEDVVKYLVVPLGVIYGTLAVAVEGIALAIKSATTDQAEVDAVQGRFSVLGSDLDVGIELPGSAVLKFTGPRLDGRVLVYDADYVEFPKVREPEIKPFMLAPFPRLGVPPQQLPHETEPQLVGETVVSYRLISDPTLPGRQWSDMPYYLLSRSQLWSLVFNRTWGLRDDQETLTYRQTMTSEATQSMEQMTNLRVTAGGKLGYKDFVSIEAATEISSELRMDRDDSQRVEDESSLQQIITYTHRDVGYTEAIWTIVDRLELRRSDGYTIGSWDAPYGEAFWTADFSPPTATRGDDGPAEFDPDAFEKSIGQAQSGGSSADPAK